jgi:hypothetical protein
LLAELRDEGAIEVHDGGEEHRDVYAFFITGANEAGLPGTATWTAGRP